MAEAVLMASIPDRMIARIDFNFIAMVLTPVSIEGHAKVLALRLARNKVKEEDLRKLP